MNCTVNNLTLFYEMYSWKLLLIEYIPLETVRFKAAYFLQRSSV